MNNPQHIAIIMDGNGRWAEKRHHPRTFGHLRGAKVAKKVVTACVERGIKYLTLYAFSTENWLRPPQEVHFLMTLLKRYLLRERSTLLKQNIRFSTIGEIERLPEELQVEIAKTVELCKNNTGLHLIFAISYGSQQEICSAVQKLAQKAAEGLIKPEDITTQMINKSLQTSEVPDPDLIIRTSGESRLSNFLLWQSAYSEFYFCETLWPDFTTAELEYSLENYKNRKRRFGLVANNTMTTDQTLPI